MWRVQKFKVATLVAVIMICTAISSCVYVGIVQMKGTMPIVVKLTIPSPASVPGSSDPVGDEWPMFRGALNHTGVAMTTPVQGTGPSWIYTTSNWIESSPAVSGGRVYVGSDSSNFYCLNATTGMLLWSYATGSC